MTEKPSCRHQHNGQLGWRSSESSSRDQQSWNDFASGSAPSRRGSTNRGAHPQDIHEARIIRDAEVAEPGIMFGAWLLRNSLRGFSLPRYSPNPNPRFEFYGRFWPACHGPGAHGGGEAGKYRGRFG